MKDTEPLESGRRLAQYEIQSRLGAGGMGAVYLAHDSTLNRNVALKVLTRDHLDSAARITREAQAASALNHPNIVTVYEIGSAGGVDFIAMEHVEGETLSKVIGRHPSLREALPLAIQIADALATAHAIGIVHRDLKPGNIMVTTRRLVKVLDFGLAIVAPVGNPETRETQTMSEHSSIAGTAAYMSPEQAEGKEVDTRTDVFSFGCVLYELFTKHRAFQQETEMGTLAAVVAKEPPPISEVAPGLPKSVGRIIEGCLRKNRAERWQAIADVKLVLEAALADLDATAPRRSRWPGVAALAALVIASAGLGGLWLRPAPKPPRAPFLRRVTAAPGLNSFPALSRDGNLLAYASDQNGGNLDIYVRQIGGRDPIRLTDDPADDSEPNISPDGARIAFRSERAGGGVWVAPALGGDAVLLAPRGRTPRFSPDGRWLAYWEGRETTDLLPGSARTYLMESGGGQARVIGGDLEVALYPVWSPQSDALVVLGRRAADTAGDWWIVPVSPAGPSRRTGILPALAAQGVPRTSWRSVLEPLEWRATGILFAAGTGESSNLWEVPPAGGPARPVTQGAGYHLQASAGGRRLAYSHLDWKPRLMTVPLGDADAGVSSGPMRALFDAQQPDAFSPALSGDGRYMTYRGLDLGRWSVRLWDSVTGKDIALVSATSPQYNPRISGNSARIAWTDRSGNITSVMRAGGAVEQLCKACGTTMGLSADGARISYEPATGEDLIYYDVPRKTSVKVADRPADMILTAGRFSPDGKWMAFHARARRSTAQIFVVRLDGPLPVPRDQWIAITAGDLEDMEPAWSPNGALLYFLSDRDGFRCIWARRLDPATRHPVGDPFEVAPFHTARASLRRLANTTGLTGLTVAPGRLVFALGELTGNIWLEERQ